MEKRAETLVSSMTAERMLVFCIVKDYLKDNYNMHLLHTE